MSQQKHPDWAPPGRHNESRRATLTRWGVAAVCLSAVFGLTASMDFGTRGYHFEPTRYASKASRSDGYDISRLRILTRTVGYVRNNYFDPDRADARAMAVAAMDEVERKVPELLADPIHEGETLTGIRIRVGDDERVFDLRGVGDLYKLNWALMDIFEYLAPRLSARLDPRRIEYAAVNGMLRTLDPHSILMTPSTYREMKLGTSGKFGGLGIVIGITDGQIVVQSVMDGTPAQRAGLKNGDKIVQIGSESTMNMALSDAVKRLRGAPGTPVNIWISRKDFAEPREYRIVRSNIRLASVTSRLLDGGVGYAKIKSFQQSTGTDLKGAIERLSGEHQEAGGGALRGFVLDLRDNPGGLLDQAIEVSDLFLSDGVIVTTVGSGHAIREERLATRSGTWSDLPLVLLVNEGSASASEIVAGAIRNHNRAVLIGARTFGKGSVQVIYDIDDAALKLTVAQYLTPGDESIQSVGITPHIELAPVSVSRKRVDLGLRQYHGEAELKNHLESAGHTRRSASKVRLSFLEPNIKDNPQDFALALGRQMVLEAGRATTQDTLALAAPIFDRAERDQGRKIAAALGKLDVDWNQGDSGAHPKLMAHLSTDHDNDRVRAGEAITLRLEVTNRGRATAYRVRGQTRSKVDLLDGRDFVLGRIPPGETRHWAVRLEVPRSQATQLVPVEAPLYLGNSLVEVAGARPPPLNVEFRGLPRPRFAYSVRIDDRYPGQNGDGVANPGERLGLVVRLTNVGAGPALRTLVAIKNRGGDEVFITDGRAWLDGLAQGETREVRFDVALHGELPGEGLQLDLQVRDTVLRRSMVHTMALPIAHRATRAPIERSARWRIAGRGPLVVRSAADEDSAVLGTLPASVILHTDAQRDGFVRVPLSPTVVPAGKAVGDPAPIGWIATARLRPVAADAQVPNTATLTYAPQVSQPRINIVSELPVLTSQDHLTVTGKALFAYLDPGAHPDLYVFTGLNKIYFERGGDGETPFSSVIPLKPGINRISIHARAGRDLLYRERVYVYRSEP